MNLESLASFRIAVLAALLFACRGQGGTFTPPSDDAGQTTMTCASTADCGGLGVCVAGLCQVVRSCTMDDECASDGKICHAIRGYCVECDGTDPAHCGAGKACQFDFTCVSVGGSDAGTTDAGGCSGTCTDRTECAPDNVCKDNACCAPPPRCLSVNDCPVSTPECNGATGECFGGSGCFNDNDCEGEAGCAGGACFCDIPGAPPGTCRVRPDECQTDEDCYEAGVYAGKVCTIATPPKRCVTAPSCVSDADCLPDGLVCDLVPGSPSNGRCVNGDPCTPGGNECGPTQACVDGTCVGQNCINTPSICQPTETCDPNTGQCVTGTCTIDADCQAGFYCNTQVNPSSCEVGCRDNNDCPGGICDAAHRCQGGMQGGMCGQCTQSSDCPSGTRCVMVTGLCHEVCSDVAGIMCSDSMASCVFGNCTCLLNGL